MRAVKFDVRKLSRIIAALAVVILSNTVNAQNSVVKFKPISVFPSTVKFADPNNDHVITREEAKKVFDVYMNNPNKRLVNDLVDEVESELIELIDYLEGVDCDNIKKSPVAKKFIDMYYETKFINDLHSDLKSTRDKQLVDSLLTCIEVEKKRDMVSDNRYSLEMDKYNKALLKADSSISDLRNKVDKTIKVSGLIDTYYSYDLNNPGNGSLIGSTGAGRVFDRYHNKLMLSMAQTKFEYFTNGLKAVVDLAYGLGGEIANYGNKGTSLIIKQVYLTYDPFKNATITVGNFATHIGYEVIEATNNFNYSVSNLFANGPFYHTGIKMDYVVSKKISVMGGVVSGWDKIQDDNKSKTLIGQVTLHPGKNSFLALNWIGGNEVPSSDIGDTVKAYKQLIDLTGETAVTGKLTLALNAAYGLNNLDGTKNTWGGSALYIKYKITPKVAIGLRSEFFDDSQKVQYLGCRYFGQTITLVLNPLENVAVKFEYKKDSASKAIYWRGKNNDLTNEQTTFGVAIIGKF